MLEYKTLKTCAFYSSFIIYTTILSWFPPQKDYFLIYTYIKALSALSKVIKTIGCINKT